MRYQAPPPRRRLAPREHRVGVPRGLGFDELRVFFDALLRAHGLEPVPGPVCSPRILARGLERCLDEVCLPLKVTFGEVAALAAAGVDTVLVPRLVSLTKGQNLCPKFHLLPDLLAATYPEVAVVAPYIDFHHSRRRDLALHLWDACRPALLELDVLDRDSRRRFDAAWRAELDAPASDPPPPEDGRPRVAVLGHLYAEHDPYLGLGVVHELARLGALVLRSPHPPPTTTVPLEAGFYYESLVRTARAASTRIAEGLDGLVLLTYFACGPDSYGAEALLHRLRTAHPGLPVLRLILDEQTAREGLVTRLATFVDVARLAHGRRVPA